MTDKMKDKKIPARVTVLLFFIVLLFTSATGGYAQTQDDAATVQEPLVQEYDKISIDKLTVVLDSYLVMADGSDLTPEVVSVSGQTDGSQEDLVLEPDEYVVKYYRIHSFSEEIYEETETISEIGEYKVTVTAKDTDKYTGEAYALFSVTGKPQKLTIAKTKYTLSVGSKGPLLQPEADGDGSGFLFVSSDSDVVRVLSSGQTEILKPGRASVTVSTEGTMLFQPAEVQVVFEVKPDKTSWKTKAFKRQKSKVTLMWKKQSGVTSYEVAYATQKDFAKHKKTKTVKENLSKTTLKGLKKEKTYYVKVRALVETTDTRGNKRTIAGPWSSVRKIAG